MNTTPMQTRSITLSASDWHIVREAAKGNAVLTEMLDRMESEAALEAALETLQMEAADHPDVERVMKSEVSFALFSMFSTDNAAYANPAADGFFVSLDDFESWEYAGVEREQADLLRRMKEIGATVLFATCVY